MALPVAGGLGVDDPWFYGSMKGPSDLSSQYFTGIMDTGSVFCTTEMLWEMDDLLRKIRWRRQTVRACKGKKTNSLCWRATKRMPQCVSTTDTCSRYHHLAMRKRIWTKPFLTGTSFMVVALVLMGNIRHSDMFWKAIYWDARHLDLWRLR